MEERSRMSSQKEQQLALLSVRLSYEEARRVYRELTGHGVGKMTAHRTVQRLGKTVREETHESSPKREKKSQSQEKGKKHTTADGAMIHIRDEGWKEAKVGACYEVDRNRRAGNVKYAATLGERSGLGAMLYDLAGKPELEETQAMAFVSDAARWLGEIPEIHFPLATVIVDFWHAAEYLWKVASVFYGQGTVKAIQWAQARIRWLRDGDQRSLRGSLARLRPKTEEQKKNLEDARRYFKNHGHKMDYPKYEAMGFHIGSGIAEGACKHVIQSRFKQTGMRWSREGAENLLRLRVCYLNSGHIPVMESCFN